MANTRAKKSPMIFISYRREDTGGDAGRLNDTLTELLGPGRTFWDLETIAPGKDFKQELKRVLRVSDILLALIGSQWETIADADGRPRLSNKDDLLRMELFAGLKHKTVRVVPILVNRETMPKASNVPSDLRSILKHNKFTIRRDRWHDDVKDLVRRLGLSGKQADEGVADGDGRRQARLVSATVEWKKDSVPNTVPRRWVVYVYNASDAPITVDEVQVRTSRSELLIDFGTVQPKDTSDYELDETKFDPSGDRPEVSMRFLDADGQKWIWRRGKVKRIG